NDSFAFSVADAPGAAVTGTFSISFTEAAASVSANTGLSLGEGTSATITSAKLSAAGDSSDAASEFVYTVTTTPTHGTLKLSSNALAINCTFTQDDVNTNTLCSCPALFRSNDSFAFSVADAPGAAATGTFNISFTEAAASVS